MEMHRVLPIDPTVPINCSTAANTLVIGVMQQQFTVLTVNVTTSVSFSVRTKDPLSLGWTLVAV